MIAYTSKPGDTGKWLSQVQSSAGSQKMEFRQLPTIATRKTSAYVVTHPDEKRLLGLIDKAKTQHSEVRFNAPKKNSPNTKGRGQACVANAASRSQSDATAAADAATHSALNISPNEPSQYQTHQTFDSQQSRFAIENNQTHASAAVYSQAKKYTCPGGTAPMAQTAVVHFPASVPAPANFGRLTVSKMTTT